MNNQTLLGVCLIGIFLLVIVGEGVALTILSYKLGVYKGRLARYEPLEKQSPASEVQF
jgi:hypothetical protein